MYDSIGPLLRVFSQGGLGLVCITQPALGFFEYKLITVWNSCLRYHLLAKASSPMKERHTRLRCQWISHSTQDTHSTTVTSVGTKYPDATVLLFVATPLSLLSSLVPRPLLYPKSQGFQPAFRLSQHIRRQIPRLSRTTEDPQTGNKYC
jgi:hypothetical protein